MLANSAPWNVFAVVLLAAMLLFTEPIQIAICRLSYAIADRIAWQGGAAVEPATPRANAATSDPQEPDRTPPLLTVERTPLADALAFTIDPRTLRPEMVVRDTDLPLTVSGWYSGVEALPMWVVLQDSHQQYYLQNPPIQFHRDEQRWEATNILPGVGIVAICFVAADGPLEERFQDIVRRRAWGAFRDLPPESLLGRVAIRCEQ